MEAARVEESKSAFKQVISASINITAPAVRVWALLTDAKAMPSWNSTITSVEGDIALGQKIATRVPVSPRTFVLTVTAFEPPRRMVWRDGGLPMFEGVREYTLTEDGAGGTRFVMTETFRGLMLPLIAGSLPDFKPIFERYAADLKRAAQA